MGMTYDNISDNTQSWFASSLALRNAHLELVERRRQNGDSEDVLRLAYDFIQRGSKTGVLLDGHDERESIQSLLDYWANILERAGKISPDATLVDFDKELAPELPDEACPYLGLSAFVEKDTLRFFGRKRLIEELVERLRESPLLVLVGSSGSGKSSVVRAGLIPILKAGAITGSERWIYLEPIVPGPAPLDTLTGLLERGVAPAAAGGEAASGAKTHYLSPNVLVIDQFEEIFTLCRSESERQQFAKLLVKLMHDAMQTWRIILTLRTDFETYIVRFPELQILFDRGKVQVPALSASELREVIERPAEQVGLKFEAGVIEALLNDILGEPAALPLLQFTLLRLWECRVRNRIEWQAYHAIGNARTALAQSADDFYKNLIPEDQVTVRRILLTMVRPGEGLEVTNNRTLRELLYRAGEARDRVDRVLDKLITRGLIRQTEGAQPELTQIEIAHEALIRNWPTFAGWLEDERDTMRRRLRLTAAAEEWRDQEYDPRVLLREPLLSDALNYRDLNELERAFLQASVLSAKRAEEAREVSRQNEIDQLKAINTELERRIAAEEELARERLVTEQKILRLRLLLYIFVFLTISLIAFYIFFSPIIP